MGYYACSLGNNPRLRTNIKNVTLFHKRVCTANASKRLNKCYNDVISFMATRLIILNIKTIPCSSKPIAAETNIVDDRSIQLAKFDNLPQSEWPDRFISGQAMTCKNRSYWHILFFTVYGERELFFSTPTYFKVAIFSGNFFGPHHLQIIFSLIQVWWSAEWHKFFSMFIVIKNVVS